MIDEYLELKELKEKYNRIKYLFYEKETGLPLVINKEKTIKEIKKILKEK